MLTLVVERSTRRPGWALFRDAACQLEAISDEEPSRTPDWLARLGAALDAAGVSLAEIDRFAAGVGPGSFSGIRAAVASLQGMALPGGKPLVGVSSAAALAFALLTERAARGVALPSRVDEAARALRARACTSPATVTATCPRAERPGRLCDQHAIPPIPPGSHTPVAVVGDARRERLWCAVYVLRADGAAAGETAPDTGAAPPGWRLQSLTTTGVRPPAHNDADFVLTTWADLPGHLPPDTVVISPDWDRIGERLSSLLPATQVVAGVRMPSAADVGRLLLSDPEAAHTEPVPIYLHPAVAEARA